MISGSKNLLIGGILLLLILGSGWVIRKMEKSIEYQPAAEHSPDYYLNHFTAVTMGDNGKPDKRLSADKMVHFPDDDTTELSKPKMTIYDENRPPWEVRSETGWVSGDKELVLLQGKVKIERPAAPGIRPLQIITSDLRVQPKNNYAETDADAHAKSRDDWVESTGMQIWFAQPIRVKLLAKVRGRYEIE